MSTVEASENCGAGNHLFMRPLAYQQHPCFLCRLSSRPCRLSRLTVNANLVALGGHAKCKAASESDSEQGRHNSILQEAESLISCTQRLQLELWVLQVMQDRHFQLMEAAKNASD